MPKIALLLLPLAILPAGCQRHDAPAPKSTLAVTPPAQSPAVATTQPLVVDGPAVPATLPAGFIFKAGRWMISGHDDGAVGKPASPECVTEEEARLDKGSFFPVLLPAACHWVKFDMKGGKLDGAHICSGEYPIPALVQGTYSETELHLVQIRQNGPHYIEDGKYAGPCDGGEVHG